jgi:protease I
MADDLRKKRVAFLLTQGVEQVELTEPRKALEQAGAKTYIVSPAKDAIVAMKHYEKGDKFTVDIAVDSTDPDDFDALVLPGGVINADELRTYPEAVKFVKVFFDSRKPVAAICHAAWILIEADVVRGRTLTSWPSLQTDIRNAGGKWVNREMVQDGWLTTSRQPADLPAFISAIINSFARAYADKVKSRSGIAGLSQP